MITRAWVTREWVTREWVTRECRYAEVVGDPFRQPAAFADAPLRKTGDDVAIIDFDARTDAP